jgi:hypothetical protein
MTERYPGLRDSRGLLGLMSRELMTRCARHYWDSSNPITVEVSDLVPFAVFIAAAQTNLEDLDEGIHRLGSRTVHFVEECMSYPI